MRPTEAARLRRRKRGDAPSAPWYFAAATIGAVLLGMATARACNTPVYRYAMYNWAPAPFFVFYFHYGAQPDEDNETHQVMTDLAEGGPAVANVLFEEVNLSLGHFDRLPEPVQEAWVSYIRTGPGVAVPAHLIFTSWGVELFAGPLDQATLRAMVDSPARTRIGKLLDEGCGTVMVLVGGSDAAENERAEKVAREVIDGVASGSILIDPAYEDPAYSEWMPAPETSGAAAPDDAAAPDQGAPSEDEPARRSNRLQVKLVKVSRSDAAEKWFVASLTKMEPDLEELSDQPMIFCFYGRGRAMWPYVGKGITAENLTDLLRFLAGPCSCMVKEQNPGLDLLMRWDWDSTADAMAANDPAFYGGPFGYQEFSLDEEAAETSPDEPEQVQVASVAPESESPADGSPAQPDASEAPETPQASDGTGGNEQPADRSTEPVALAQRRENVPAGALATVEALERQEADSFVRRQMWTLGVGAARAAVVVLGVGLIFVRRRAANGP